MSLQKLVIPAKAGIQYMHSAVLEVDSEPATDTWIPACAGMTV